MRLAFVLIPHDLVQWNAVIPRVALALWVQEAFVATQVALQPKPTVAVAPSTFHSRDALRNPETVQQIQWFHDSVPAIPPERDATTAVELFSKCIVLASFAPRFAPGPRRPWITEPTWAVLQQLLEAKCTRFATIRPQAQTGSSIARL